MKRSTPIKTCSEFDQDVHSIFNHMMGILVLKYCYIRPKQQKLHQNDVRHRVANNKLHECFREQHVWEPLESTAITCNDRPATTSGTDVPRVLRGDMHCSYVVGVLRPYAPCRRKT